MKEWILSENISTEIELTKIESDAKEKVKSAKKRAWEDYKKTIDHDKNELLEILT